MRWILSIEERQRRLLTSPEPLTIAGLYHRQNYIADRVIYMPEVDTEKAFTFVVDWINDSLVNLGVSMDDIAWSECHPDTIRYPLSTGRSTLWGFIVTICHKDGRRATGSIVFSSDTCPVESWYT